MCDVAPFLPRWPVEAAVGSNQSWPDLCHPGQDLPHQLAAPEVCSSLYYLMWSETLTANLWENEEKKSVMKQTAGNHCKGTDYMTKKLLTYTSEEKAIPPLCPLSFSAT